MSSPFPGFYNLLDQHRYSYPQQEALIFGDVRLSFQSIFDRVNALANGLSRDGVGESDRVLYMGQNSHAMVEILLACSKIGATVCYVNWRQSAAELVTTSAPPDTTHGLNVTVHTRRRRTQKGA